MGGASLCWSGLTTLINGRHGDVTERHGAGTDVTERHGAVTERHSVTEFHAASDLNLPPIPQAEGFSNFPGSLELRAFETHFFLSRQKKRGSQ